MRPTPTFQFRLFNFELCLLNFKFILVQAKKSLGQHFLTSDTIVEQIVTAANLSGRETVLEVGPGKGILTEALLARAQKVVAVEKDAELAELLTSVKFATFIKSGKLNVVTGDILTLNPDDLGLVREPYKIVANIPYYITGQFLRKFLETQHQPSSMVLMLQKEVAERIVGRDGKESILSIAVKAYGEPHYVQTVEARNFSPSPKVDSAILAVSTISRVFFENDIATEKHFFELLRQGFAHKRKLLRNNLGLSADQLISCGIQPNARAERLTREEWKCLTGIQNSKGKIEK